MRTLLDLPTAITLQDIAADGRVLATLNTKRLDMAFSTLGDKKEDVDLSWHDLNTPRDISPDGQYVVFEDASEAAGPGYSVVTRKVDGSLPTRLGEGSAGGMSPDGKWVISISTKAAQLTLLPVRAGQPRQIDVRGLEHLQNGWARFLPNGQGIALNGNETGHAPRCYVVDVSTGQAKAATPEGIPCGPLSPDNRYILGIGPNRSMALYPLDGGTPRVLPSLGDKFNPVQWSQDGSFLYGYHLGEFPGKIYKVEIASGKETMIQELRPGVPAGVVIFAPVIVSRDGTRFAYAYNQTLSALYLISGLQ